MRRESIPQRALEMHRRTGVSLDDCLIAAASQDAIEHPEDDVPPLQSRVWTPRAPKGRLVGKDRCSP
jgi:hypothetical protein